MYLSPYPRASEPHLQRVGSRNSGHVCPHRQSLVSWGCRHRVPGWDQVGVGPPAVQLPRCHLERGTPSSATGTGRRLAGQSMREAAQPGLCSPPKNGPALGQGWGRPRGLQPLDSLTPMPSKLQARQCAIPFKLPLVCGCVRATLPQNNRPGSRGLGTTPSRRGHYYPGRNTLGDESIARKRQVCIRGQPGHPCLASACPSGRALLSSLSPVPCPLLLPVVCQRMCLEPGQSTTSH